MTALDFRDEGDETCAYLADEKVAFWHVEERNGGRFASVALSDVMGRDGCIQVVERLRSEGVGGFVGRAPLLRYTARKFGYGGGLRAPLVWGSAWPSDLVEQVELLLPGTSARMAPPSRLRAAWSSAVYGLRNMTRLEVTPDDGRPSITVTLPQREDLDAEAIAAAVDITLAVRDRFGPDVEHVRSLSFDHSSHGFVTGRHAGNAPQARRTFHLNASLATASGNEVLATAREARRAAEPPAQPARPPAAVPAPWLPLDGTVAHELWHKIEVARDTERYEESVAFRRAVGALFGCITIEQVFTDPDATLRLTNEVSGYATTNRLEATAEMFKQWWCGPPPAGSVIERFGHIVDEFFPPS